MGILLSAGVFLVPRALGISEAELRVQVSEYQAKLDKVIESRSAEQAKAEVQEERLQSEIAQMRERLERMKKEESDLKRRVKTIQSEQEDIRGKISRLQEKQDRIKNILTRAVLDHASRVERGIPYNRELRMSDFSLLEKDMAGGRITLKEGLERLIALLEQETYLSGENELYLGTLPREKRGIQEMRFLRLGMVSLAYVSSDGKEVGLLVKEEGNYSWNTDLSSSRRRVIRQAVELLEGREKFQLVGYPISGKAITTVRDDEE